MKKEHKHIAILLYKYYMYIVISYLLDWILQGLCTKKHTISRMYEKNIYSYSFIDILCIYNIMLYGASFGVSFSTGFITK